MNRSSVGKSVWALVLLGALVAGGCGGATVTRIRPSTPFTAEHAAVFDDGVDYVSRPDALDGDWREQWDEDMQKRVGFADVVAVVSVDTVRTDTNLDRRTTYRLVCTVQRNLFGQAPRDGLTLVVHEGNAGFASVHGSEQRILNQGFVAFVKWYEDDNGVVAAHWHLSPASEPIITTAQSVIERRNAAAAGVRRPQVIEITH